MQIKQTVDRLCRRYRTRNPIELAQCLGTVVLFENLGSVRGYYGHSYRQKVIHINCHMNPEQQIITCAHELGHSIMHPHENTPFLRANTFLSVDRLELEANRFMTHIVITDEDVLEYVQLGYSVSEISNIYGLPNHLIEYKIRELGGV